MIPLLETPRLVLRPLELLTEVWELTAEEWRARNLAPRPPQLLP